MRVTSQVKRAERPSAESSAVNEYLEIVERYDGELDGQRIQDAVNAIKRFVAPGSYVGPLGSIRVYGLSWPPSGGSVTDIQVNWSYRNLRPAQRPMPVIMFLELYRRFEPDLV